MGKIKTITPIHIASGNSYYAVEVRNNYIYSLDYALDLALINGPTSGYVLNELCRQEKSKDEFISLFDVKNLPFDPKKSVGKLDNSSYCIPKGYIQQQIRDNETVIIPGSSLKGYIMNVLWYDVICKNHKVLSYFTKKMDGTTRNYNLGRDIENFNAFLGPILNFIGVRDIPICNKIVYGKVFVEIIEMIPENSSYDGEILIDSKNLRNIIEDRKNVLMRRTIEKEKYEQREIKTILIDEFYKRIVDLKKYFINANREFMKKILSLEYDFVKNTNHRNVNYQSLTSLYNDLIKQNETKTIIQIGRYTNFFLKTDGIAFKDNYEKYFYSFFKSFKNQVPKIENMKLIEVKGVLTLPLGFMEIEL